MPKHFPEAMILAGLDRQACRDLLRAGSRSFFAASHLLPRGVREPATALYAFCRLADDAVDFEGGRPRDRREALVRLNERLDLAYRGTPRPFPADRAFAITVERFDMPRALPEALLEGLAWDAEMRRYETLSDLLAYAARVAGAVGAMMAVVMGVRDRAALARACDLGAAMQLTNIARDIGEDARAGRLYLPLAWMREADVSPERLLAEPSVSPAIRRLTARLLQEAAKLYHLGESGIDALPLGCRPGIRAASAIYAAIGEQIERLNYDTISQRAVVSSSRKLALCLAALAPPLRRAQDLQSRPAQPETRFLVDAVLPKTAASRGATGLGGRVMWVLDLFERVEERRAGAQIEEGA